MAIVLIIFIISVDLPQKILLPEVIQVLSLYVFGERGTSRSRVTLLKRSVDKMNVYRNVDIDVESRNVVVPKM